MLERYARPEMLSIWSKENQYRKWLEVEIAVCEAWAELGAIPQEAVEAIKRKASFDVDKIAEIEAQVRHDLIAFLENVAEHIGEEARYLHYGLTSSDVKDTALALQMREAMDLIIADVGELVAVLKEQAFRYRDTVMMGRTHGMHAEPITLGLVFARWAFEMARNRERLHRARQAVSVGKISGAVGTYAALDPRVEELACRRLGLKPDPASSQIISRDRHAEYLWSLAITGCSVEKFAQDIRLLQRTEVGEVEEPFAPGQKGSSAMPHKRNPILAERLCGLARLLRSHLHAALENIALWHERDISHSSVERFILPEATSLLDYILISFTKLVRNLKVNQDRMKQNLQLNHRLYASERVMLALVNKGLSRQEAYKLVQEAAFKAWEEARDFGDVLREDATIASLIPSQEIEKLLEPAWFLRHTEVVFQRLDKLSTASG
ncbi:MAG: adenylosuccinate lyase [Chloroflexi bacterium]|nr:MAG: adenylosuccinate lyase [Chloroflexota bacterium]